MLRLRVIRQMHTQAKTSAKPVPLRLSRGVSTDTYSPPSHYSLLNTLNRDQNVAKNSQELQRLSLINKSNVKGFQESLPKSAQLSNADLRPHSLFVRSVDTNLKDSSDEWSSPNDDIVFSPSQFKIDNNLWGLIDAAIKAGQLQRAQSFIANLGHANVWREDRIRLCARMLAEAFIEENTTETSVEWLGEMSTNLGLKPDQHMYAHLLSKVVDEKGDVADLLFEKLPKHLTPAEVVEEIQIVGLERLPKVLDVLTKHEYAFSEFGEAYIELFEELTGESMIPETEIPSQTPEERLQMLKENQRGSEKIVTHTNNGEQVVGIEIVKDMLLQVDGDPRLTSFIDSLPYKDEIPADLLDPSKKISLFNIKNSLSKTNQADFEERLEKLNMARQLDIELRGIEAAGALWEARMEQSKAYTGMVQFQTHMHEWKQKMVPLIEQEIKRFSKKDQMGDMYPYLRLLKPETMALVTIIEMMRMQTTVGRSTDSGVKTSNLVTGVGGALETEYRCAQWSELLGKKRTFLSKLTGLKRRLKVQEMISHEDLEETAPAWALDVKAKVGGMLIDLLIKVARIPVEAEDPVSGETVRADVPVFGHSYALIRRQRQGVVRMHHSMTERIAGNKITDDSEDFVTPQFLPMLAKPKPWVGWKNGGYYISQASVMRAKESSEQTAYLDTASERGDLKHLFAGLNKLGSTAWTVNEKIFATMSQVWNTGEGYLDIPAVNKDHSLPEAPEHNDPGARAEWRKECTVIINKRKSDHSVRCDANYKLEIARAHIGEKMFFPHNVDFRGRAYPLSPHFNHLGSDLSRGLLMFWEGKELGPEGLKWLKVHMANLYGQGKSSYDERVAFTDSLLPQIRELVKDPLHKDNLLWHNADYPWQFLAACHELVGALDSPDPEKFVSHIPVQQDGSCNGLQHYAALGGDIDGARQVNLTPFDRPQDVYAEVAAIVSDLVEQDAKNADHEFAPTLVGKINRKIVKPTVMTNVYGVTFIGAKAQIYTQLKEQYDDIPNLEGASHYLATRVFSAMRSLFTNAHDIQDWLTECARRITKTVRPSATPHEIKQGESLSSVIWTSPIGLPVVQPYRKNAKRQVETALQSVFLQDAYTLYGVQSRKQAQAFPPNFVHSLDASHMLLTALNLGEDVSFASVHDSYWTHACDVPEMNRVLREQFVKLHSMDIVGNLQNELLERYGPFYSRADLAIDNTELGQTLKKKKALTSSVYEQLEEDIDYRRKLNGSPKQRQEALENPSTVEILEQNRPLDKYLAMQVVTERVGGKVIQTLVEAEGGEKKRHFLTKFQIDEPPKKGDLDLNQVLVSPYFFS